MDSDMTRKKMIVLLPENLAGSSDLARHIHRMAAMEQRDVLYLTLIENQERKPSIQRSMTTMNALTASNKVMVAAKLIQKSDWLQVLKNLLQPGDLIVCHDEQSVETGFARATSVRSFLKETLNNPPVRVISGYYRPWQIQLGQWVFNLLFWVGCLTIMALFTFLEIQLDGAVQGLSHTILFCLLLVMEFGTVLLWSRLPHL